MNLEITDRLLLMNILIGIYHKELEKKDFDSTKYEWHLGNEIIHTLDGDEVISSQIVKRSLMGIEVVINIDEPYHVRLLRDVTEDIL